MTGPGVSSWGEQPLDAVRKECARVAGAARSVRIDGDGLTEYAAALPTAEIRAPAPDPATPRFTDPETTAAWALTLNAVNFGSGWFPELQKRPGHSGFRTIEACLRDRFEARGLITAPELSQTGAADCLELFEQTRPTPAIRELADLYASALRDLGRWVELEFDRRFLGPWDEARGSVVPLVRGLLEMPLYRDVAQYDGAPVPFLKRAQITAFDLDLTLRGPSRGAGLRDLHRLTLFADNLVPHVLRLDGVLVFDPALVLRIDSGDPLLWGSPEEVEIRACALHVAEELARRSGLRAADLDGWLWRRGAGPLYKSRPRHRSRCPYY